MDEAGKKSRNPSFLIVSLRYIGDVLLSTPLALSIKTHLPHADIDYLVFKGTEAILARNDLVRRTYTLEPGLSGLRTFARLWRRYDYALGVNHSDRAAIYCLGGGRQSIGFSLFTGKEWWKEKSLSHCHRINGAMHTVPRMLSLLEPLKIPAIPRVGMGYGADDAEFARRQLGEEDYILLHPYTRQPYKYWPAKFWATLAALIHSKTGLRAIFTRSSLPADEAQFAEIEAAAGGRVESFPQSFSLCQLAAAIHQGRGFVGVDTVATHMAAALEKPTVAIYGSTLAQVWGPWPNGCETALPYSAAGRIQTVGCITVLQQTWPCVPCGKEYCLISNHQKMECLENLPPDIVFDAVQGSPAFSAKKY